MASEVLVFMRRQAIVCAVFAFVLLPVARAADFHFTVGADPRGSHANFRTLCQSINSNLGGTGAFHVSVGDVDNTVAENRAVIDDEFGVSAVWWPIIGNHEIDTDVDIEWLRAEYDNANSSGDRTALKNLIVNEGPTGTKRVCYSWDEGNAHFVALNLYWDGGPVEGTGGDRTKDDTGTNGDVVAELRTWLDADLTATTKDHIFVFGHEPAFPQYRHVGDSLDAYPDNRDAFWTILENHDVAAYFCGHTHAFYKHEGDKDGVGGVWQIDAGNEGNSNGDGHTYVDVVVTDDDVRFDVYREHGTGSYALAAKWYAYGKEETIAYTEFEEPGVGDRNWSPGAGDEEMGFTATRADETNGPIVKMGVVDSVARPSRYRTRTVNGELTLDTVDLTGYWDVSVNVRIAISETGWEAADFFKAVVKNGLGGEITLVHLTGADAEDPNIDDLIPMTTTNYYMWYRADIPDDWAQAILVLSSRTNAGNDSEYIDFDSIYFTGIPEPFTAALLAVGAVGVLLRRRRRAA